MNVAYGALFLTILGSWTDKISCHESDEGELDLLLPYLTHHGPKHRTHRQVRDCQHIKYGNRTHSKHKAHHSISLTLPLVKSRQQLKEVGEYYYDRHVVTLSFQTVNNPLSTLSVLEPGTPGTCGNDSSERQTVRVSGEQRNCILATNAGFFDTTSGECLGNIYSDGRLVKDSGGIQNAHFGLTEDGYIFTGYLSELDLLTEKFTQLVSGVIWLIREGEVYVDESIKIECSDTEETGTLQRFATVQSARVAVGHDKDGRVLIAEIDGKTGQLGVDLYQMASILLDLGFVNAINLDGGGSATVVINDTLVSHPSDKCPDKKFNCERKVTTILCVHEPDCQPQDCSGHGQCQLGRCTCSGHWSGPACDKLECPANCSGHGTCSPDGCVCDNGWHGNTCSTSCPKGKYGFNCSMVCCCQNGGVCDPTSGECNCEPGFSGKYCQSVCPYGFYGARCSSVCNCDTSCFCDPITGSCNNTHTDSPIYSDFKQAGRCVAEEIIKSKHLVADQSEQYRLCLSSSIVLGVLAAVSIILNIVLFSIYLSARRQCSRDNDEVFKKTIRKFVFHGPDNEDTESNSDDSGETTTLFHVPPRKGKG